MKIWKLCGTGLVLLTGLTPTLSAQIPTVAPAVPAPTAAPRNLWSFLCPTPEQKLACKDKLCKSKIGQFLNQALKPAGALTGGALGPFCPGYFQEDLKKPADSAEGAAARVKKDEAEAKARRAAVRYLGTVDCHYWPEAQDALVNSLRGDRNECVRWEAALALMNGCCCTRKTVEALAITVSGSEADGNPSETSERVRAAALAALEGCLARLGCPVPLEGAPLVPAAPELLAPPKENPPAAKTPGAVNKVVDPIAYYKRVENIPMEQVVEHARRSVMRHGAAIKALPVSAVLPQMAAQEANTPISVDGSLLGILNRSLNSGKPVEQPMKETVPPAPAPEPVKQSAGPQPKRGGIKPVVHQQPSPAPVTPSGTNRFPMTAPQTKPAAPPQPAAPPMKPQASMRAPMNPQAMAQPAPMPVSTAPAVIPVAWNPLQERQQLAPPPLPAATVQQSLRSLREAIVPDQREWAAANLATVNWQAEPQVVEALQHAAVKDSAPTVRVACIRSLARLGARTTPVLTALQALKNDSDPRVQTEATRALERLSSK